jgi:hypothetical protein
MVKVVTISVKMPSAQAAALIIFVGAGLCLDMSSQRFVHPDSE